MNQSSKPNDAHHIEFYDLDHEIVSSIILVGVTEEKAVEVAKSIYFATDEGEIDSWDLKDKKEELK